MKWILCGMLPAGGLGIGLMGQVAKGQRNLNPGVIPPHARPYGLTYGEWGAQWWRWAYSFPSAQFPPLQSGEVDCSLGQSGSVWFLAGASTSTTVTRSVTIPAETALFFPLVNTIWVTYPTDPPMTIQEIRDALTFANSLITDVSCEVDGVPVKSPLNYAEQSAVFSVTLPANNIYGIDAGTSAPCVDEGFYLLLAPLARGEHTIHFTSDHVFFGTVLDITYHLTVK